MGRNKILELEHHLAETADQRTPTSVRPQRAVQDFNQLRQECLAMKKLFEDPEFPAQDSSVYYSERPDKAIEWKRPTEIASNPKLFVDGFSRFDLTQGDLSDCWFIAATAHLAMHPELFLQVVPEDQSFEANYAGIFHFRFWQYGKWVDVVIDDRLPTNEGKLMYLGSPESNEFWGALIEKAYAKLHGSYEALVDGMVYEALEDFTGGIAEIYDMDAIPPNLFNMLLRADERNSLMGCLTEQGSNARESETPEGLLRWHCYSITQVKYLAKECPNQKGKVLLLRLRNPWGNAREWNGEWSDRSPEWNCISDSDREEMGLQFDSDGEFWMTFQDFKRHFTAIDFCHLTPDSLMDPSPGKKKWEMSVVEGEWVRGVSAGGCYNFLETFWQNPQYRITLEYPDEFDDKCTVIVSLVQKNRRAQKWKGINKLHIGFAIYHLRDPNTLPEPLDENFFTSNPDDYVGGTPMFLTNRGANCRFKLSPGVYCVIPSTFEADDEGEFLLRVFSDSKNTNMRESKPQVGIGDADDREYGTADVNTENNGAEENMDIKNYDANDLDTKHHGTVMDPDTEDRDAVEDVDTMNYGAEADLDTESYDDGNLHIENPAPAENVNTKNYDDEYPNGKNHGDKSNMDTKNHDAEQNLNIPSYSTAEDLNIGEHNGEDSDTQNHSAEEGVGVNNYNAEDNLNTNNYDDEDLNTENYGENYNAERNAETENYGIEEDLDSRRTYSDEDLHAKNQASTGADLNTENHGAVEIVDMKNSGAEDSLGTTNHTAEENMETNNHDSEGLNTQSHGTQEGVELNNYSAKNDLSINNYDDKDQSTENGSTTGDVNIKNYDVKEDVDTENYGARKDLDTRSTYHDQDLHTRNRAAGEDVNTNYYHGEDLDKAGDDTHEGVDFNNYSAKDDLNTNNYNDEDLDRKNYDVKGNLNSENYDSKAGLDTNNYSNVDPDPKNHCAKVNVGTCNCKAVEDSDMNTKYSTK